MPNGTSGGGRDPRYPLDTSNPVRVYHGRRNAIIAVVAVLVIAALAIGIPWVMNRDSHAAEKGTAGNPVVIGVVGATDPQWVEFKKQAEAQGLYVQIKDFQDYTSENPALAAGDLDMNEFQHLLYLANYNVSDNQDLQPIGGVAIFPLGVYSQMDSDGNPVYTDISQIPEGSTVAIPNDETNQARAIGVLKAAGLVTLKNEWTAFSIPQDIDESASKVKVVAMKAEQIANSLKSDPTIAAGVINNDYVADAGLSAKDAIYQDDAESEESRPYINVFVVRADDVDNPVYQKAVEIFQSDAVLEKLQENSDGTAVFANNFTTAQLQQYLKDIEQDVRDNQ
ncbi:MetQ/NlpA family ABC transporter substrate-binding protein [Bifidobacterium choloepi]|uniref:ABC transporter substrate-binding protein n=1 Tax=Bifidobacterium choloepi TaxID=2614131 RepID=A0A6I5NIF9_9BIFI|nr:MetQ/NlpA family ABC transporter substrate-binding protein [Bifidobacterium choloepi]NEG70153.1 ABC transporter substrate-binding protein [Bifidobacterium choloepi]